MSFSVFEAGLGLVFLAGLAILLRATLKGGKQIGTLWDKREEHKRARESRRS